MRQGAFLNISSEPQLLKSPVVATGAVVITTVQLHSTKPELRFCAGKNPACGMSEIRNDEDL